MDDLNVTLIQSDVHWQSVDANLAMFEEKLWTAGKDTDLIVLPEMFNTGFTMQARQYAEPVNGKTHKWMMKMAEQFGSVIAGSLIVKEHALYYNRLLWVEPGGRTAYYDKRHLFRMSDEHNRFTRGRDLLTVRLKGWKIRPLICYDLRFPVWSRNKMIKDKEGASYDALVWVANWPASRIPVWDVLLTARAIENTAYCIGLNRVGTDGEGISYNGHSRICDFTGNVLTAAGDEEKIITCRIPSAPLLEYRENFPVHFDGDEFNVVN